MDMDPIFYGGGYTACVVLYRSGAAEPRNPVRYRTQSGSWTDGLPPLVGEENLDFALVEVQFRWMHMEWRPFPSGTYPSGKSRIFLGSIRLADPPVSTDEDFLLDVLFSVTEHEQLIHQMPRLLGWGGGHDRPFRP